MQNLEFEVTEGSVSIHKGGELGIVIKFNSTNPMCENLEVQFTRDEAQDVAIAIAAFLDATK
jgi:hypothetical protein